MKILIVSDTHKSHRNLERVIEMEKPFDLLIHLGDVEGADDYIEALVDCPVHIVRGNNDFFSDLPAEKEIMIDGNHVFLTHGHYYYVSMGEERIRKEAKGRGADVVMYGHTHMPSITEENNLIMLNPGSIAYPRQQGRHPSYIVMDTDEKGQTGFEIRYL